MGFYLNKVIFSYSQFNITSSNLTKWHQDLNHAPPALRVSVEKMITRCFSSSQLRKKDWNFPTCITTVRQLYGVPIRLKLLSVLKFKSTRKRRREKKRLRELCVFQIVERLSLSEKNTSNK